MVAPFLISVVVCGLATCSVGCIGCCSCGVVSVGTSSLGSIDCSAGLPADCPTGLSTFRRLSEIETKALQALNTAQSLGEGIEDARMRVYATLGVKKYLLQQEQKPLLLPFFYKWATLGTATKTNFKRFDLYSYNLYSEVLKKDTTFADVDYKLYSSILKAFRDRGLRENTIGTHIGILKAVMNEAYKQGLHNNLAFKDFAKPKEPVDTIYLTQDELNKIKALDLPERLTKARDLFLVGCYTAMRYSDYSRITPDWIKGDTLQFTEKKTNNRNIIPLSENAKVIIERYEGVPKLSETKLNIYIKEICQRASIDDLVNISYTAGGQKTYEQKYKWELVSTHTARRTGATLMIKAGAPVAWVMKLTGHKSEASFWKYVRLSSEEYAQLTKQFIDKI